MFGLTAWDVYKGLFVDKFVKRPLLALAHLGHWLALWL